MSGQLVFEVLELNLSRYFVCGHRGHPEHLVTSGLATVILTVHQKCAVIIGIGVTWQDTYRSQCLLQVNSGIYSYAWWK
jgi:hypothetical protein